MAQTVSDMARGTRSGSITAMLGAPEMADPLTAADVARFLLRRHSDYAGGRAATWPVTWPSEGRRRTAEQWVEGCEALLAERSEDAGAEKAEPVRRMTTRTCLLLLGLLDPA